ncbi:hypothetical protein ABEB36_015014 [Hypothenemus hampei]|uniref:Uncharacterized protein n=1 Tax=Hypothenemus hampei TaxID=57062 RepID=A0ABD1E2F2_HYPHA
MNRKSASTTPPFEKSREIMENRELSDSDNVYSVIVHHPSGAQKRKIKKIREQENEALGESLLKFGESTLSEGTIIKQTDGDREPATSQEERENINICEQDLTSTKAIIQQTDIPNEGLQDEGLDREMLEDRDNLPNENDTLLLDCDVGNWPIPLSNGLRTDIIKKKSEYFQNKEGPFEVIQRTG